MLSSSRGIVSFVAGSLLFASAGVAQTITLADGPGTINGGEFNARLNAAYGAVSNIPLVGPMPGGSDGSLFATFCVEFNEFLGFGPTYDVALNNGAVGGGVGGQTSPGFDPLDEQTGFLYSRFTLGILTGYDYANAGIGRASSANALQAAIWLLENEITALPGSLTTDETNLANSFLTMAAPWAGSGEFFGVHILNLTDTAGRHQDVLVMIPLPPSAWAGLSSLAGVGLLSMARSRRRVSV